LDGLKNTKIISKIVNSSMKVIKDVFWSTADRRTHTYARVHHVNASRRNTTLSTGVLFNTQKTADLKLLSLSLFHAAIFFYRMFMVSSVEWTQNQQQISDTRSTGRRNWDK
jgi:hypothetical protein